MNIKLPPVRLVFLCAVLQALPWASAQITDGHSLLPDGWYNEALLMGPDAATGRISRESVEHPNFDRSGRVTTSSRTSADHAVQLRVPLAESVKAGDVLFVEFWVRRISTEDESGDGRGAVVIEESRDPYVKAVHSFPFAVGDEWLHFTLPVRAAAPLDAEHAVFHIRLGMAAQELEIGGLNIRQMGPDYDMASLPPAPRVSYAGRDADAEWRIAAAERIDQVRKGDLTVRVVDANGQPVPHATVKVQMTKHAFLFSSAIAAKQLLATEDEIPGADQYRAMTNKLFNMVTMESDLKWPNWEQNKDRTMRALRWLNDHDLLVRGHVLLWPSWRRMPADTEALAGDPDALRARIENHFEDILTTTGDLVMDWDVINEPQTHFDALEILGNDFMVNCFQLAKRLHANGKMVFNEALNFSSRDKLEIFEQTAIDLKEKGAPIEAIGFQCHYSWTLTPPEEIFEVLDRFAKLGVPLQITEFDITTDDEELQADYLRDFFTMVFSHPSVDTIQMWGFWEGRHWRASAALWKKDWSIKPSGQAYMDLVFGDWWTDEVIKTNDEGSATARGFLGDYQITVEANDERAETSAVLAKGGSEVTVTLGEN